MSEHQSPTRPHVSRRVQAFRLRNPHRRPLSALQSSIVASFALWPGLGWAEEALSGPRAEPARVEAVRVAQPGRLPLPPLSDVLEKVRVEAPEVRIAVATVRTSDATMTGARRPPLANPVVTSFMEYGHNVTNPIYMESQLDLPVELWSQRKRRIAESKALSAYSSASLEVARANALASALESYALVLLAHERSKVLKETIAIASSEASLYRARTALGDATERDARVAELELARNQVLMSESQADLHLNLSTLQRLTRQRYSAPEGATQGPPWALARSATEAENLPSVVEAVRESEYHERAMARSKQEAKMPFSVIVRGAYGDSGEGRVGGGFAFGIPVFQKNQGEVAKARASMEQAQIVAEANREALVALLEGTRAELEQLEKAIEILDQIALPAAAAAVSASEEIQRAGKSDLLPVLISRRDYAALRLRRLDILGRSWGALARIVRWKGVQP